MAKCAAISDRHHHIRQPDGHRGGAGSPSPILLETKGLQRQGAALGSWSSSDVGDGLGDSRVAPGSCPQGAHRTCSLLV